MQQWVIDNMPVTWCYKILESDKPFCTTRFPVGCYVTSSGQRHDACFLSVGCSLQCVCAILIGMHKHKFASHQPLVHVNYEVYRKAKAQQTNHMSIVHHLSPATKAIVHELCAVILAVTCLSSEGFSLGYTFLYSDRTSLRHFVYVVSVFFTSLSLYTIPLSLIGEDEGERGHLHLQQCPSHPVLPQGYATGVHRRSYREGPGQTIQLLQHCLYRSYGHRL